MSVTVTARLPDGEFTTDGERAGSATEATWQADLGDDPVSMAAASEARDTKALALAAVSIGALVLLVLLLLVRLIRGRRRRRRGPTTP
jgi:hypothetical protein